MSKPRREFIYGDHGELTAVIEPLRDGRWRLIKRKREAGVFQMRDQALAALDDDGRAS